MAQKLPLKTYRGNCHCSAFVYTFEAPEIKTVHECNCSICYKKGYLWVRPSPDTFVVVQGSEEALTTYTFSTGTTLHKFCPTCATPLMGVKTATPPEMRRLVNAHAIQGINTRELQRLPFNGAALEPSYASPRHSGEEPSAVIENASLYYGSCHCGAVTLAFKSQLLDKNYPGAVSECNCSSCERNASIWVYPKREQVVIRGEENMGKYYFGTKSIAKTFCKKCGINLTNAAAELDEGEIAALDGNFRGLHALAKSLTPFNLRVLNGFHISEVKDVVQRVSGPEDGVPYVSP
ncbi:glutathione-dependent formaldehyde-activating enzyme [Echria macrotheca]|uniref:Glutathione-dependent formaldehyde-activating enzyme n=1 Tax=Echria macrotheca TaxID=438768 RepID=A0AAJ0B589_9PEZI|nr:glutathione-dependent formaldehyde-activating enzyme [Echria macrotheca]